MTRSRFAIFTNLKQSYGSFFMLKFRFHSMFWELTDGFWPFFFFTCIDTNKIFVRIATHKFSPISNIFMDLRILFFAQYVEKELLDLDQILHAFWYWHDLGCDHDMPLLVNLLQSYGPWMALVFFCFFFVFFLFFISILFLSNMNIVIVLDCHQYFVYS